MDEFYFRKTSHVPAFGSWDCNNEEEDEEDDHLPFPFTQCFESARQAGLLRYSYSEDRDLYDNHLVPPPAVIVVPRRRREGKGGPGRNKEGWVMCDYEDYEYECDAKAGAGAGAAPSPVVVSHIPTCKPKAVDEDLYKISPDLLRPHPKRKGVWGFFSSCLRPSCVR